MNDPNNNLFNDAPSDMKEWVQQAQNALEARNQLGQRMSQRQHLPLTGMVSVEQVLHAHERELGRLNEDGQALTASLFRLVEEHVTGLRYMIKLYRENQYLHDQYEDLNKKYKKLEKKNNDSSQGSGQPT